MPRSRPGRRRDRLHHKRGLIEVGKRDTRVQTLDDNRIVLADVVAKQPAASRSICRYCSSVRGATGKLAMRPLSPTELLPGDLRSLVRKAGMAKFLLWCILLVICWPLAFAALVLYPVIWLLLLPLRIAGIAVCSAFVIVGALFTLPARVLRGI